MTPEAIVEARRAGRLDLLMRGADLEKGAKLTTEEWHSVVSNMTDDELAAADAGGRLDALKAATAGPAPASADQGAHGGRHAGTPSPASREGQRARLQTMTPAEIVAAQRRGELDGLLGRH
jgi:hypothetical protein